MPFPKTRDEAETQGYKFLNSGKCSACGVSIEWYETPSGKRMPIKDPETFTPHWMDCPAAAKFRKK